MHQRYAWLKTLERLAFAFLVIVIPFRLRINLLEIPYPPVYSDYTDVLFFLSDGLLLATLAFWGVHTLVVRPKFSWGPRFLTYPLIGMTVLGAVSAAFSVAPLISWMHVARLTVLFFFYIYLVNTVRSANTLHLPMLLQVGVQSVVAVSQFVIQRSIGLGKLGEYALDPSWFGVSIVWAPGQVALRSYGLTDHPNILGGSLALGVIFLILTYPNLSGKRRLPTAFTIALGLTALLLTFSRSAWLGLASGLAFAVWMLFRIGKTGRIKRIVFVCTSSAIIVLPFLLSVLPFLSSRLSLPATPDPAAEAAAIAALASPEDRSVQERAALLRAANELFIAKPITGSGLGTFPIALLKAFPDFGHYFQPVHFILMDAAAEIGLPGALFYLLAIGLPFGVMRMARERIQFSPGLVAATGMLVVIIVIGFFDYYFWFLVPGRLMHWLVWGSWAGIYLAGWQPNA